MLNLVFLRKDMYLETGDEEDFGFEEDFVDVWRWLQVQINSQLVWQTACVHMWSWFLWTELCCQF